MNVAPYIGIAFVPHGRTHDGCDCWGLVRLVYLEQLGIQLPSYAESYATVDDPVLPGLIEAQAHATGWRRVDAPAPWDVLILRQGGRVQHCGLVLDSLRMLHVARGADACIERFNTNHWQPLIHGCYRYPD